MRAIDIRIGDKDQHDTPLFPEERDYQPQDGELVKVGILEGGMESGQPSLWFVAEADGALVAALEAAARRKSDLIGGHCWCVSSDEPHEGWVHGQACEVIREYVKSGKFSFQMSYGQLDAIAAAVRGAMGRWSDRDRFNAGLEPE